MKSKIKQNLMRFSAYRYFRIGRDLINNYEYQSGRKKTEEEFLKTPSRTEIINFLSKFLNREICYLEIGVRNPNDNYKHINATKKYSVDPGLEYKENPVDFVLTSDAFFNQLQLGKILSSDIKFDIVFIDGLHLAEQVDRDIANSFRFLREDGFIILHDCNPPTEWHARENHWFSHTPAEGCWNGTTWKAFLKWRQNPEVNSCCVDCDWGVGILSKTHKIGNSIPVKNSFFEFSTLNEHRTELLNLVSFNQLKQLLSKN